MSPRPSSWTISLQLISLTTRSIIRRRNISSVGTTSFASVSRTGSYAYHSCPPRTMWLTSSLSLSWASTSSLCIHHGSPGPGGGRDPPGTHSECRTGAMRSPNESRPRADPGPASGRVSPDPGASTPGTSGLGQSKPPPFRYSFLPPPRAKATPVGLVAVSIKIFQTPHIFKITHIIFGAAVFVFIQIKHKLKPLEPK